MKDLRFIHLHVHTQYSLLDGTIRLRELFQKVKEYNMPAVAITDHGNMFGAIEFYREAIKQGIKPIIGCELYVAPDSRFKKTTINGGDSSRHLLVLVKDLSGYKNLMKLTTAAYLEGFYYRPRVDKELLSQRSEGLMAMSACLHGEVAEHILKGNKKEAIKAAEEYREIFGTDNFFLELMENGLPEQSLVNDALLKISKELSIPLVATNDCHYLEKEDAEIHDVLLCIQTGKTISHKDRMRFRSDEFYFKSPDIMRNSFKYCIESIDNTAYIASECNLQLEFGNIYLPQFIIDTNQSLDDYLRDLAFRGLKERIPTIKKSYSDYPPELEKAYEDRLNRELEIIRSMGFAGYFLIVADFVNYAKRKGIPVGPGRGSAAGSLVAYTIGITDIDPIKYHLFFERFLNPDRISMPDIDIDFCQEGRNEVIQYVTEKYGKDHVAQIITFGKMQARAVIRDVGRALNIPYGEVDAIAKLIPNVLNITLEEAMRREPRLQEIADKNPQIAKLIKFSQALEGLNRHASTHAAGVVISDIPLVERVPLCVPKEDVVTQFTMNDIQAVGLTKFDFLGLKTLTVIKNVLKFVKEGRGEEVDIHNLPLDDPLTYQLLMRGDTDGVFQLESAGMKDILVNLKPDCIEDIIALIALYRPGPMSMVPEFIARKQGKTKITYEVPQLEEILKETYGIILYQEQVMQIAVNIGGYTMAEADNLRKVMSKKMASEMEKEKPKFLEGAKRNKIPEQKANRIWEQMESFAEYGFNKSHSTAYAIISYQTAYLKAHYPVEFMAALLTSEKDNRDKMIKHISTCKEMGISVLPPDINESARDFSVVSGSIRFGLAAVKNVGVGAIEAIISAREIGGKFLSFIDFCERVDLSKVNKRVIESLIKCGAFDTFGYHRSQLFNSFERIIDAVQRKKKTISNGKQVTLFEAEAKLISQNGLNNEDYLPEIPEWEMKELLAKEKETLGFYITSHPLFEYASQLSQPIFTDSEKIGEMKDKENVTFAGIVNSIREVTTKRKEVIAYVTFEDLKGTVVAIFFAEAYKKYFPLLHNDDPLVVKGFLDISEENIKVIAQELYLLKEFNKKEEQKILTISLDESIHNFEHINNLKEVLQRNKGNALVYLRIIKSDFEAVINLGENYRVRVNDKLMKEIAEVVGREFINSNYKFT